MNTAHFWVRPMTLPSYIRRLASASVAVFVVFSGLSLNAQTNAPSESADRYLFIVETSSAMKKRTENTAAFVGHKVTTGLDGHVRPGSTMGLWTFDDTLSTGKVPLQRWSGENSQKAAAQMVEYLRKQTSDKPAKLAQPVQAMNELIKKSDRITVLLITSGEEKITGTPYDADINESFRANAAEQKKKKLPFVTVLRAVKGEYVGFRVSTPPWPVELPAFPAVTNVAKPAANPPPQPTPPVAPPPTPQKKAEPTSASHTNLIAPTAAQPEKVVVEAFKPLPADHPATLPQPPANAIPQTAVNAAPAPEVVNIPQPNAPPADLAPATPPKVQLQAPVVAQSRTALVPQPAPAQPAEQKAVPAPPPPAAAPDPKPDAKKPAATISENASTTQATVIPSSGSSLKRMTLLVGGSALIVGAAIFLFAQMRRPRKIEKISLITHTVERKQ